MPPSTTPKEHQSGTLRRVLVFVSIFTLALLIFYLMVTFSYLTSPVTASVSPISRKSKWLSQFSSYPHTQRLGCREYTAGAQSCVFQGIACINTSVHLRSETPRVILVDDARRNHEIVPSDDWCKLRYQSADPRYWSSRHWPIKKGTFAPQGSCLNAEFRTFKSLRLRRRVRWLPNLWLIDLDMVIGTHNYHLFMDIIWMLDVQLWQSSIDFRGTPSHPTPEKLFDTAQRHVYLPQSRDLFIKQTSSDINRLMYAIILQLDTKNLYPKHIQSEPMTAIPLFDAYPHLEEQLAFHKDFVEDNSTDLVCTPRLTAGAKLGTSGHERVCRTIREKAFELFNVSLPKLTKTGRILYHQPPKRVVIVDRHITRKLANVGELERGLREAFDKYGVEIEVVTTKDTQTVEGQVRVYSRAGVLLSVHGSHNMAQMFMQRHAALIEIMPVGYNEFSFHMLADSCKVWFYELQAIMKKEDRDLYEERCGDKLANLLDPCHSLKSRDVLVNVPEAVKTVRFALQRLGYYLGDRWEDQNERDGMAPKKRKDRSNNSIKQLGKKANRV